MKLLINVLKVWGLFLLCWVVFIVTFVFYVGTCIKIWRTKEEAVK